MSRNNEKYKLPDLASIDDIESILIIRFKALGDIALTLPIIKSLRQRLPEAKIDYLVFNKFKEALAGETGLDEVLVLPENPLLRIPFFKKIRNKGFDLVLDLISSPVSAYVTFFSGAKYRIGMDVGRQRWCYTSLIPRVLTRDGRRLKLYTFDSNIEILRLLNLEYGFGSSDRPIDSNRDANDSIQPKGGAKGKGGSYKIGFPAAATEKRWADDYIKTVNPESRPLIGVVVAANYQAKSWPVENFIELCNSLIEKFSAKVMLIWGPGEIKTVESVSRGVKGSIIIPEVQIAKLGAIVSNLDLLVGLDSGPKHIAVLEGVPTVTLFGPTDPEIWDPMNDIHRAIYLNLRCSPCRKKRCDNNKCMTGIKVSTVVSIISNLISGEFASSNVARKDK